MFKLRRRPDNPYCVPRPYDDLEGKPRFPYLSQEQFNLSSVADRIAYLKRAIRELSRERELPPQLFTDWMPPAAA
jgi:hypothetical protein